MSQIIEHEGVVTGLEGKKAFIKIEQTSACSGCHAKTFCTASDKTEKIIEATVVDNSLQLGDIAVVYGQKSIGVVAVLLAYVFPFCIIILSLFIFNFFLDSELLVGTLSLSVLLPYLLFLLFFRKKINAKFHFYASKKE